MTRQYIGARYVPIFANPVEWNNLREYEPLTIVTYQGTSYTSKKTVPVGTGLDNKDYWVVTGNYNQQVESYRQETIEIKGLANNTKSDLDEFKIEQNNTNTELDGKISSLNTSTSAQIEEYKEEVETIKTYFTTPERFGAKGDGITDDSEAITRAVALGIPVVFSNKTYVVNSDINIGSNVKLIGNNTTIKSTIVNNSVYCFIMNGDNIEVSGFTFLNVFRAIDCIRTKFLHLHDLKISSNNFGIRLRNASFFTIENIYFEQKDTVVTTALSNYPNTDGVHINGTSHDGIIRNITGTTCDDMISICSYDGMETGNIYNIVVDGVDVVTENIITSNEIIHNGSTFDGVRLLMSNNSKIDNVVIRNVNVSAWFAFGMSITGNDTLDYIPNITVENCNIVNNGNQNVTGKYSYALIVDNVNCNLSVINSRFECKNINAGLIYLNTKNAECKVKFDGCKFYMNESNDASALRGSLNETDICTLDTLEFLNCYFSPMSYINGIQYLYCNTVKFDGLKYIGRTTSTQGWQGIISVLENANVKNYILINSEILTYGNIFFSQYKKGANVTLVNNTIYNTGDIVRVSISATEADNTLNIYAKGNNTPNTENFFTNFTIGTNAVRLNCDSKCVVNVDALTPKTGDTVNIGTAIKIYNGSAWV